MFSDYLVNAFYIAIRNVLYHFYGRSDLDGLAHNSATQAVIEAVGKGEQYFEVEDLENHIIRFVVGRAKYRAIGEVHRREAERRMLKRATLQADLDRSDQPSDSPVEQVEIAEVVRQVLAEIGPPCNRILTLRYAQGCSDKKIAMEFYGDQAGDAQRQQIRSRRVTECLPALRRRLFDRSIDPEDWL